MTILFRFRPAAALAASLAVGLVAGCARQSAPPGGPEDRRPPVVVRTIPDTFATVTEPFRGPVRFLFDERISERVSSGSLDDAVLVSPRTGAVRVEHGRQGISVTVAGGFKPDLVYRVTLLPVISDLFNNQLRDPFELVFSTGAPLIPSAVAGIAWDRTNGEGVAGLSVEAVTPDSTVYVSDTDSAGIYVFRYLPPGRYVITAFDDQNRNGERDPMETTGTRSLLLNGPDTVTSGMDIPVLKPDTTPARLTAVTPMDSVTVLLDFDHFLDPNPPTQPSVDIQLQEPEEGDTLPVLRPSRIPVVTRVFQTREYTAWREELQDSFATLDSLEAAERAREARARRAHEAADTARPAEAPPVLDTLVAGAAADTTGAEGAAEAQPPARRLPPALPGSTPAPGSRVGGVSQPGSGRAPSTPDGSPLPDRRLVVRLDTALVPNVGYRLSINGVVTLNGVPLGGGEGALILVPPPPPDSTGARGDSLAVPDTAAADSTGAARDTVPRVPPPDTVPPDTMPPHRGRARPGIGFHAPGASRGPAGAEPPPFLHERRR